jgi:uncharacterized membrane protein YidH (DUF202 family)
MTGDAAGGTSDPGLAGERTQLAWARTGLALLAVPAGVLAFAAGSQLAVVLAAAATVSGLAVLTLSLRRHRTRAAVVGRGDAVVATAQVLLAGVTVLLLDAAALVLVVGDLPG